MARERTAGTPWPISAVPDHDGLGHEATTEGAMTNKTFATLAKRAVLVMAEIKTATDAFERGDTNVFDALDAIRVAVESYAEREAGRREAA